MSVFTKKKKMRSGSSLKTELMQAKLAKKQLFSTVRKYVVVLASLSSVTDCAHLALVLRGSASSGDRW